MSKAFHKFCEWEKNHPITFTIIIGVLVCLVVEIFNQRSFGGGLAIPFDKPLVFVLNASIISTTLLLSILFRKRSFFLAILSLVWIVLAVVNFAVRTFRTTPLRALDFRVARSVMSIVEKYFSIVQIILFIALGVVVIAGLVFAFIKTRKLRPKYLKSAVAVVLAAGVSFGVAEAAINFDAVPTHFDNLTNAYVDYGFTYCFAMSLVGNGISKPETYSQLNVDRIIAQNTSIDENAEKRPNIVFVQLESYFDIANMMNFTFSEPPTPNMDALKEKYPWGRLHVASFGTGTANTEFDILTGMNVQFFGAGEYPYSTIMRETTCPSINYSLKELGYSTHAIHNHNGNFYARNKVYPNLGFDSFTSVEYMQDVEYNVLDWAKDRVLTYEIMDTLKSTETPDFVFAVSVQPHGRYSEEKIDDTQTITLEGAPNEGVKNAYEYYVNQLHQTDEFVGELVDTIKDFKEPTVLVFYGDHLPNIGMDGEDLKEGYSIYDSEYVIVTNYKTKNKIEGKDLATYQLGAYIQDKLGFNNSLVANIHKNYNYDLADQRYSRDLKMIQYDVLYGEEYFYGEENPKPEATEMTMGIHPIVIDDVIQVGENIQVIGDNFTELSMVSVGGDKKDTIFVSKNQLIVEGVTLEFGEDVRVLQMASARKWLSRTEKYFFQLGTASVVKYWDQNDADAKANMKGNMIGNVDSDDKKDD